ncbi:hypothetical protein M0R45_006934 [Rubus argutus]|uniref:Uncharacterized protein n=1 Tax=Rubus argutus TaxID=59490 RepID=A0AAW1YS03_RUBAR
MSQIIKDILQREKTAIKRDIVSERALLIDVSDIREQQQQKEIISKSIRQIQSLESRNNHHRPTSSSTASRLGFGEKDIVLHHQRGRGGSRPHSKGHWPQGPPQQGLHCQSTERPPRPARRPPYHSILQRAGPALTRQAQQGRQLAHQEGQGRNQRARGAVAVEPFDTNIPAADCSNLSHAKH